jgi:hypothetical protein
MNEDGERERELNPGDRIMTAKSFEFLNETMELQKSEQFVKTFLKSLGVLVKEQLTGAEYSIVVTGINYLRYVSGVIAFENGKALNKYNFMEFTSLSESSVEKALAGLVEKKIFSKNKTGHDIQYFVNPFIFMRGERINKTLYVMFKNSKWARLYQKGE